MRNCAPLLALVFAAGCEVVPLAVDIAPTAPRLAVVPATERDTVALRTRLKIVSGRAWLEDGALHVSILVSQPGYDSVWVAQAYIDTDRDAKNGEEFVGRFVERTGQYYPVRRSNLAIGYGEIVGYGWLEAVGRTLHTIVPLSVIDDYDGLDVAIGIFTPEGGYVYGWRGTALPLPTASSPVAIRPE